MVKKGWKFGNDWVIENLVDMPSQHLILSGSGTPIFLNNPPPGVVRGSRTAYAASQGNISSTTATAPIVPPVPPLYPNPNNFWTFDTADIVGSTILDVSGTADFTTTIAATETSINNQSVRFGVETILPVGTLDPTGSFTFGLYIRNNDTGFTQPDPWAGNQYPDAAATDTGWWIQQLSTNNSRYSFYTYANGTQDTLRENLFTNQKFSDGYLQIMVTFEADIGRKRIYINGKIANERIVANYVGQELSSSFDSWFARAPGSPVGFNSLGFWDEAYFWRDTALTEEEVQNFYEERAHASSFPTPTSYWSMDDDSITGTTLADQIGSNDGTIVNSPLTGQSGLINESIEFDNSFQQYVDLGTAFDFTGSFSVATWFLRTTNDYNFRLLQNMGAGTNRGWFLEIDGDRRPYFSANNGSSNVTFRTPSNNFDWSVMTNQWVHIVATYDNSTGTATIYFNGTFLGSSTNAAMIGSTSFVSPDESTMAAAKDSTSITLDFDGRMDEVAMWDNVALTEEEAKAVWLQGVRGLRLDAA